MSVSRVSILKSEGKLEKCCSLQNRVENGRRGLSLSHAGSLPLLLLCPGALICRASGCHHCGTTGRAISERTITSPGVSPWGHQGCTAPTKDTTPVRCPCCTARYWPLAFPLPLLSAVDRRPCCHSSWHGTCPGDFSTQGPSPGAAPCC